jgi:threonine aldolase
LVIPQQYQNDGMPADQDPRSHEHTEAELTALRDQCTRFLHYHGPVRVADLLATVPAGTVPDRYGAGGVVADLEGRIAALLGKPAAVFLPSGTMAQQAVLRVHADQRQRRTVLFHPCCHIDVHEGRGYQRLHQLTGRPAGDRHRLLSVADLAAVAEPPAALVLELPQRDLGGQQPSWDELAAQLGWAREQGAAAHLDGARLWESAAGYGRPPADIAGLFDTVYVSFYKGLGALPGCCVAGPEDVIGQVREWRHRMGGTLFGLWPNAASALTCLDRRLPLMPRYLAHARAIAEALRGVPGVQVVPDPPQTPMMHLLLGTSAAGFRAAAVRLAKDQGIWTWPESASTADPRIQRVELTVGDMTLAIPPGEVAGIVAELAAA